MKKDFIEILYENRKFVIIFSILLVIVGVLIFTYFSTKPSEVLENKVTTTLKLFGPEKVTLALNEEYEEIGYYAVDSTGKIKSKLVNVHSNLDTTKPGIYTITYEIDNVVKTRTIEVLETQEYIPPSDNITLSLKGDKVINLSIGDNYIEPGFIAFNNDEDLTSLVMVDSNLDTSKVGEYTITYKLSYNGIEKEVIRTVIILDDSLNIIINKSQSGYTNSYVTLNVTVQGDNFVNLVLPNKVVTSLNNTTYNVTTNGTYTFTAYNINGKSFTKSISINEIDNESPSGTCNAIINNDSTLISVSATDNLSGIKSYDYYDNNKKIITSNNNTYIHSAKTSKYVNVTIYDNANNKKDITCTIMDNSYLPPITPGSSETIVKKGETDTLKVYITKVGSYYITRVWAYDPYNQLNKFDSPEYGSNLYKPSALLNKAKSAYNLTNDLLVGFNASGFYLKNTYDADSVAKYSKYDKTSVGTLVITNGKVIRNAYDKAYKTWYTFGIDKTNTLKIFTDSAGTSSSQISTKKEWANKVINSGIRNTFTFASPLIENGKKSSKTTSMPSASSKLNRQAICQIDSNNFALITGSSLNRTDLQNIMLNLDCQTGTNLDGGGSIALLYQARGSNKLETIIGNSRALTEVAYFSE